MPFTLLQGGTTLQTMDTSGTLTSLTLPTGIKLDSTLRPRLAVFGKYVVVVNSPTRPLTVDPEGVVRYLSPRPPRTRPVLSAVSGGALAGTYIAKQTFRVYDTDGNVYAESAYGPASVAQAVSTEWLKAASLDTSSEKITKDGTEIDFVNASYLYRTLTLGTTVFFPWLQLDGNTQTSIQDDLSDANLQLISAPTLGSPPDLALIAEFRSRLFGRSKTDIDTLRWSEASRMYAWSAASTLVIPKEGADTRGITGVFANKDVLCVGRQNRLFQIAGDSSATFRPIIVAPSVGVEGPDTVDTWNGVAYFLAKDGVYAWGADGIRCISDGMVRSWFTTDTYFNRSRFQYAVGRVDTTRNRYRLLLANAGDSVENRWVEFDITANQWWGPHKTDAFTPSFLLNIINASSLEIPTICSTSGFAYQEQATRTDDTSTGIALDVNTKLHDDNSPNVFKWFDELELSSKIQSSGSLTITPSVGENMSPPAQAPITADMTLGHERLRRIGTGRFVKFNFANSVAGVDIELNGYELPWHELGDRE